MHFVSRVVVALVAFVVTVSTSGLAVAAEPGWERVACSSGVIGDLRVTGLSTATVEVSGHLDCAASVAASFGYARYDSGRYEAWMLVGNTRRYASTAPTLFSEEKFVDPGPLDFAICVVTDYRVRVACFRVLRTDSASRPLAIRLGTNAPMVSHPVRVIAADWYPHRPACGGCW